MAVNWWYIVGRKLTRFEHGLGPDGQPVSLAVGMRLYVSGKYHEDRGIQNLWRAIRQAGLDTTQFSPGLRQQLEGAGFTHPRRTSSQKAFRSCSGTAMAASARGAAAHPHPLQRQPPHHRRWRKPRQRYQRQQRPRGDGRWQSQRRKWLRRQRRKRQRRNPQKRRCRKRRQRKQC